jgi:hypothetical protein
MPVMDARRLPAWVVCVVAGVIGAVAINFELIASEDWLLRQATVMAISQWDASNLLGMAAFRGGWATAWAGFGMHLLVSTSWATIFVFLASRFRFIREHPVYSGLAFGVVVMLVMIELIVPHGRAPFGPPTVVGWVNRTIAHALFFGVPVALTATVLRRERPPMPQRPSAASSRAR